MKTLKEQLKEKAWQIKCYIPSVVYLADAKEIVDGLVAEIQKRIDDLNVEQNVWFDALTQVEIETYRQVLLLLGEKKLIDAKEFEEN